MAAARAEGALARWGGKAVSESRMASDPRSVLYERQPTRRFSDRAEAYARYRPDYPGAAMDAVLEGLHRVGEGRGGENAERFVVCADIGAGTGISSRMISDRGAEVWAVEPNAAMRAAATALGGEAVGETTKGSVSWLEGTAEQTGLDDASVDVVLAAQAFHWFRVEESTREFARVLRRGKGTGRLALVWNRRDNEDDFTAGYTRIVREASENDPAEERELDEAALNATGRFTAPELVEFAHGQVLDEAGVIGRARSVSYVPGEGPRWERARGDLSRLFAKHERDGVVRMAYRTRVFRCWAR